MSSAPSHQPGAKRSPPSVSANSSANTGSSANRSAMRPAGSTRWAATWSSGAATLPASAR